MKSVILISVFFLLVHCHCFAQKTYPPNWESLNSRPIPEWFIDAKFGIFIHWGVYSVPAWAPANNGEVSIYGKYSEWYWWRILQTGNKVGQLFREYHDKTYGKDFQYQDFAPMFKAEHFDPVQWADLFTRAGAKYVILTSKHVEGFTLWPSSQSWNWNSVDIGPHLDICGNLSTAVKDAGLRMGFYYSLYEWFNPLYQNDLDKYVDDHMIPQMKDLVTRYHPDIVWSDGEWDHPSEKWKSAEFLSWLYNESPVKESIVVNDRWGKETRGKYGGFYTTEYDLLHDGQEEVNGNHPWEECRGIGTSFGYNRAETPDNYMSSGALIHLLVEKVAAGGNLLLNVGPTADGRIPAIQQQRLLDMGQWLGINGDAIYGTRKWEKAPATNAETTHYFTTKGKDLYVIVTQWQDKPIVVKGVGKATKVTLLGFDGRVKHSTSGNNLTIVPPAITPANNPSQFAWVFKVENVQY